MASIGSHYKSTTGERWSVVEFGLVVARTLIAFLPLIVCARLLGKQQIAELSVIDFVIAITIGSIASTATVEFETPPLQSAFAVAVWAFLAILIQHTQLHNRSINTLINGRPRVLIDGGRIDSDALRAERITVEDLLMLLRKKGAFNIQEVEVAVLERDGTLSVLKRSQHEPLTPQDMGIPTQYKGLPTTLIVDGHVDEENLRKVGQTRPWLIEQLRAHGASRPEEVLYCALDTTGSLYVDVATPKRSARA